jgi:hypothetical protein
MSSFTSPLVFEPVDGCTRGGRALVRLTAPFSYDVGFKGSSLTLTVPAGFVTDFASVPRALTGWFPPSGPWAKAAVVHDYLYASGLISRAISDLIFLEAMEVLEVPCWRRAAMYAAVRLLGWRRFGESEACGTRSA